VQYPAVVKPISGRGSRGVHIISSKEELGGYLALYKKKFEDVLVQQHIEGEEYTISVIVNDQNEIIGIVPKRAIEKRGITRIAVVEHNALIEKNMRVIVDKLRPCGPFNVQLKLLNNKIYIFEINPRLSTTAVLTDKAFGNEVELCLKYKGKTRVAQPSRLKTGIKLFRYEENVFIGVNGKKI
jgi:carbamoyl-phosphate synthase large subunit